MPNQEDNNQSLEPGEKNEEHFLDADHSLSRLWTYALQASQSLEEVRLYYTKILMEADLVNQENERAYQKLKDIRHKLIQARTLTELLTVLFKELKVLNVDYITVCLAGELIDRPDHVLASLPDHIRQNLFIIEGRELDNLLAGLPGRRTYIGSTNGLKLDYLLKPTALSCVVSPLLLRDRLIGCLSLGSFSADRFTEEQAPDLLEDLAVTAALCVDNVIVNERNERLATTDPLTGTFNRRYFFDCASRYFDLARRHQDTLSCIYLDLNDFKPINDRLGHEVGDQVLRRLVQYISSRVRRTDILARLGGDEFALLLPRVGPEEAQALIESFRAGLAELDFSEYGCQDLCLSASFGAASLSDQDEDLQALINRADQEMYEDKGRKPSHGSEE